MDFTIMTGMSGSGKTQAVHILEDLGYFCIDNLPPSLIPSFADIIEAVGERFKRCAIVVDIRVGDMINELLGQVSGLRNSHEVRLVFLDASDETLVKRYKETRRTHPLNEPEGLKASIEKERKMLSKLKDNADLVIDTTLLKITDLRNTLKAVYSIRDTKSSFEIRFVSFGFKHGIPTDTDMVFDLRCFKNPFYVPELKNKTGNDKEVQDFVMSDDNAVTYLNKITDMIEFIIPIFRNEGRYSLVVAVGCTGGHHRSVTFANKLAEHFSESGYNSLAIHRDINL